MRVAIVLLILLSACGKNASPDFFGVDMRTGSSAEPRGYSRARHSGGPNGGIEPEIYAIPGTEVVYVYE